MTQPPTQPSWLPPEGWYPNPENPEQQRWWDGSGWTEHVAVGAPLAPGAVPHVPGQTPVYPTQAAPADQPPPPPAPSPYGTVAPPSYDTGAPSPYVSPQQFGQPPQQYGQSPQPAYGQPPRQYAQPQGYSGYQAQYAPAPTRGLLPDGGRVAGWWWRVLARVIDGVLLWIPASILGLHQIRVINRVISATPQPTFQQLLHNSDYAKAGIELPLIFGGLFIVYELIMLKAVGASVGKLICGLRVRAYDRPGPLRWSEVLLRVLTYQVPSAVPNIGPFYVLIDVLWPLWDGKRQALHDKAASTAVIRLSEQPPPVR